MVWYGMVYGIVWCSKLCYVWYGRVWYNKEVVWYGSVCIRSNMLYWDDMKMFFILSKLSKLYGKLQYKNHTKTHKM